MRKGKGGMRLQAAMLGSCRNIYLGVSLAGDGRWVTQPLDRKHCLSRNLKKMITILCGVRLSNISNLLDRTKQGKGRKDQGVEHGEIV